MNELAFRLKQEPDLPANSLPKGTPVLTHKWSIRWGREMGQGPSIWNYPGSPKTSNSLSFILIAIVHAKEPEYYFLPLQSFLKELTGIRPCSLIAPSRGVWECVCTMPTNYEIQAMSPTTLKRHREDKMAGRYSPKFSMKGEIPETSLDFPNFLP